MKPVLFSSLKYESLRKIKVGVVCGGTSPERRISMRSGRAVWRALKRCGIPVVVSDPADRPRFFKNIRDVDVLFLALHGNGGEDGSIQKYLERRGLIFTGSPSEACRKSFDKEVSKRYFKRLGIPTPPYVVIHRARWQKQLENFAPPYFVKPLDGGSSQGVFQVEDFRKSAEKIRRSIHRCGKLLVEKKIFGRELTAGLLGDLALPIVEVKPSRPFYDYKAKYTSGLTAYEVPAKIPDAVAKKIQKIALRVYRGLGLKGFSRVDVMLDSKNRPYVLEVNSIPGLTEFSLLPKAARARGICFEELCLRVLNEAINRKRKST